MLGCCFTFGIKTMALTNMTFSFFLDFPERQTWRGAFQIFFIPSLLLSSNILFKCLSPVSFFRKIEIVQFASRTRQLFVRLLALVKWASNAGKVEKCAVCSV